MEDGDNYRRVIAMEDIFDGIKDIHYNLTIHTGYKNMFAQVCYLSSFNKFDRRVNIPLEGSLYY